MQTNSADNYTVKSTAKVQQLMERYSSVYSQNGAIKPEDSRMLGVSLQCELTTTPTAKLCYQAPTCLLIEFHMPEGEDIATVECYSLEEECRFEGAEETEPTLKRWLQHSFELDLLSGSAQEQLMEGLLTFHDSIINDIQVSQPEYAKDSTVALLQYLCKPSANLCSYEFKSDGAYLHCKNLVHEFLTVEGYAPAPGDTSPDCEVRTVKYGAQQHWYVLGRILAGNGESLKPHHATLLYYWLSDHSWWHLIRPFQPAQAMIEFSQVVPCGPDQVTTCERNLASLRALTMQAVINTTI